VKENPNKDLPAQPSMGDLQLQKDEKFLLHSTEAMN